MARVAADDRRGVAGGRRRRRPGAAGRVLGPGAGDPARRQGARVLAGRGGPAAARPGRSLTCAVARTELPPVGCGVAHLVWDWNGTLLDDLDLVVDGDQRLAGQRRRAARHGRRAPARLPPADRRRTTPTCWAGRWTVEEFATLDRVFHDAYRAGLARVPARRRRARAAIAAWPGTQSLLSMFFHHELVPAVDRHGLDRAPAPGRRAAGRRRRRQQGAAPAGPPGGAAA